jgi:pyruvate dehydrogenase E1 component
VLGTDGYGRSDSRRALRDFFEVNARHIVLASLKALKDEGLLEAADVQAAIEKLDIDTDKPNPVTC